MKSPNTWNSLSRQTVCFTIILLSVLLEIATLQAQEKTGKSPITKRIPWETSTITGTPEPPPPYVLQRVHKQLEFSQPVEMVTFPDQNRACVLEREGKIHLLSLKHPDQKRSVIFEGRKEIAGLTATYGLAFHPDFKQNRYCYLCYILKPELPNGTRVSRFKLTNTEPPLIDASTEKILLEWKSGGHNGGSLKFGPDGYLYVSTGDGSPATPADTYQTGQDISDLLASILRIDVNSTEDGKPYGIPDDNPFVNVKGAAKEVWSYGHRNPWRMSFDRKSGELWVGDVGYQLWEMVFRIQKGGNYGWSIMEGSQVVRPDTKHGPTPILPAILSYPRSEGASVTGGYVYRGSRYPTLEGKYIYGDYVSGKVWALALDNEGDVENEELTDSSISIICFHEDPDGELLALDYSGGGIYQLVPNPRKGKNSSFPRKLSETGLFSSVSEFKLAPGVIPFSINASQWHDHARAEYAIAIPGTESITLKEPTELVPKAWGNFPHDSVIMKTLFVELERGNSNSMKRIETQILHFDGSSWRGNSGEWRGYTYLWRENQTEASLAPEKGFDFKILVKDDSLPEGRFFQPWRAASRAECYLCHNPWAGYRLGFTPAQLDKNIQTEMYKPYLPKDQFVDLEPEMNQLSLFKQLGLLGSTEDAGRAKQKQKNNNKENRGLVLVDPHNQQKSLNDRARSYLHVNCAHCHRFGGGGTAAVLLHADLKPDKMLMFNLKPTQGAFGLADPKIVASGDPFRSVLYYRMAKSGRGHMPYIGAQMTDHKGLKLIGDWIASLSPPPGATQSELWNSLESLPMQKTPLPYTKATDNKLLDTTFQALHTQELMRRGLLSDKTKDLVLQEVSKESDLRIYDLFEEMLPNDLKLKRIGMRIDEDELNGLVGNVGRGRNLFAKGSIQCRNCHVAEKVGKQVGPALDGIGKKRSHAELLESLRSPSKVIDPKYVSYVIETKKGRIHTGLLMGKTNDLVRLRTSENKELTLKTDEIELMAPQSKSLMPELLYKDMTLQQLADLLEYLESLK